MSETNADRERINGYHFGKYLENEAVAKKGIAIKLYEAAAQKVGRPVTGEDWRPSHTVSQSTSEFFSIRNIRARELAKVYRVGGKVEFSNE